jgi:xanthine/CO dehydrogenase XdhC/CoxF family maturation factor
MGMDKRPGGTTQLTGHLALLPARTDLHPMNETDDTLAIASAWREAGEAVALATVVKTWGSSPRPVGSQLAVTSSGRMAGSVSGGCIEAAVAEAALATLATGRPEMLSFGVTNERAWEVGLACGGQVSVFVEPIRP